MSAFLWVLSTFFIMLGLFLMYWIIIRPVLMSYHFFDDFHRREQGLMDALKGFRTRIAAWFVVLASALVGAYDLVVPMAMGIDWAPITEKIPPIAWPFITLGIGLLFRWLRWLTTGPEAAPAPIIGAEDPAADPARPMSGG
jgi:hypothetical protein